MLNCTRVWRPLTRELKKRQMRPPISQDSVKNILARPVSLSGARPINTVTGTNWMSSLLVFTDTFDQALECLGMTPDFGTANDQPFLAAQCQIGSWLSPCLSRSWATAGGAASALHRTGRESTMKTVQ